MDCAVGEILGSLLVLSRGEARAETEQRAHDGRYLFLHWVAPGGE